MSICTNRQKISQKARAPKILSKKIVHNFDAKKAEKMSYTRSYPRYPQKNSKKTMVFKEKQRTDVL